METWDAIRSRRNVRNYTAEPLSPEHLDQILEAGRRAPSSRNWQPWDFVVISDRDRLTQLAQVWQYAGHVARSAATIALVAAEPADELHRDWLQYDLGQASMAIMLAATDLGVGTGHAAVGDQDLARSILGHPPDRFVAYLIALGYPTDRPLAPIGRPDRRPFDDVVHRDRW
jgi:nitroreductase